AGWFASSGEMFDKGKSGGDSSMMRSHVRGGLIPPPPALAQGEVSGQKAVMIAKTLNELKESDAINKQDLLSGEMKTIEDKTFYLVNGFWTDSSFTSETRTTKEVKFGTDEYFELLKSNPGISKFLSVGKQVIVEFKGSWYRVVQSGDATG
ncbi:MAG: hypothetical protein IAF58_02465, partial [Leptolyngbya sp.]|nr:hypothetical protein [Candidatus Melainabacteria bacterium]